MDDFKRIAGVPAFIGNMNVGHMGTYWEPNGGRFAQVATAWLEWQLKGDEIAKREFVGKDCGLCKDPEWTIDSKGLAP
jgi:hypothetical protein